MRKRITTPKSGFSLVEVALALGVASFCMITLLALIPVGVSHYQQADAQSTMVNIATMVTRDLQSASSSSSTVYSPRFQFPIPSTGSYTASPQTLYVDASGIPAGTSVNVPPASTSLYRVTVLFYPPATTGAKFGTLARIWVTFPALADSTPTTLPTNYSSMFETTVALNRN